jgi:hypothetical protein
MRGHRAYNRQSGGPPPDPDTSDPDAGSPGPRVRKPDGAEPHAESAPYRVRRLNDAAAVLWRDRQTVQLELGPRRVTIGPIKSAQVDALVSGGNGSRIEGILDYLEELGYIVGTADADDAVRGRSRLPARLRPELLAVAGLCGGSAESVLERRRSVAVAVLGGHAVSATITAALAAAGIGAVRIDRRGDVTATMPFPGGVTPRDEGRPYRDATHDAISRIAPDCEVSTRPGTAGVALAVVAGRSTQDPVLRRALHLERTAHLALTVGAGAARIGPLVIPGRTSCLNCADHHRTERDPAWPTLAAQLSSRGHRDQGIGVGVGLSAVGVAVSEVLRFVDAGESTCIDGTLELQQPDWRLRRRSWAPHPDCDCAITSNSPITDPTDEPPPFAIGRQNEGVINR